MSISDKLRPRPPVCRPGPLPALRCQFQLKLFFTVLCFRMLFKTHMNHFLQKALFHQTHMNHFQQKKKTHRLFHLFLQALANLYGSLETHTFKLSEHSLPTATMLWRMLASRNSVPEILSLPFSRSFAVHRLTCFGSRWEAPASIQHVTAESPLPLHC